MFRRETRAYWKVGSISRRGTTRRSLLANLGENYVFILLLTQNERDVDPNKDGRMSASEIRRKLREIVRDC